jgi:hypothetical protein
MQTSLTLAQLRDLFYYEDRLGITMDTTPNGHISVPRINCPAPEYFDTLEEAFAYMRGVYTALSDNNKLPPYPSTKEA